MAPTVIRIDGIGRLQREIFGPVLHVATFRAQDLDQVIEDINATGYGLTFGLHTRIDDRVQSVVDRITAGNIYVNRNQIGAVVGSQPFGGEGLSGTGPKAGGPDYLPRFAADEPAPKASDAWQQVASLPALTKALLTASSTHPAPATPRDLPGPTGESNRLSSLPRPPVLCLGPGADLAKQQVAAVEALGGIAVPASGRVSADALTDLAPLGGVLWWGDTETASAIERALAHRDGPIIALSTGQPSRATVLHDRHVCIDTTAAGGNAALLAEVAEAQ